MLKWWLERDPLSRTLASQPFSTLFNPFYHLHTQKLHPPRGIDVFPFLINLWLECGPLSWAFTSFSLIFTPRGDPTYSTSPILAFGLIFDLGTLGSALQESYALLCVSPMKISFFIDRDSSSHPSMDPTPLLWSFVWSQHPSLISHPSSPFPHPKWCALQEKCALPLLEVPQIIFKKLFESLHLPWHESHASYMPLDLSNWFFYFSTP